MKRKTRRSLAGRDGVDAHQARIPLKPLWLIIFCQPATEGSHSTRVVCGKRFSIKSKKKKEKKIDSAENSKS